MKLDSRAPVLVDLYCEGTLNRQVVYEAGLLRPGKHSLLISRAGQTSGDCYAVAFDAVDVLGVLRRGPPDRSGGAQPFQTMNISAAILGVTGSLVNAVFSVLFMLDVAAATEPVSLIAGRSLSAGLGVLLGLSLCGAGVALLFGRSLAAALIVVIIGAIVALGGLALASFLVFGAVYIVPAAILQMVAGILALIYTPAYWSVPE